MAEKIKKGDFVEIIYVGREKESNRIFDLNDEKIAKKEGIYDPNYKFEGKIICVGQEDILKGIDEAIEGKEIGQKFTIELSPEKAFGKKDSKLYQMVPMSKFKHMEHKPYPGLVIEAGEQQGVVKLVNPGRVIVDFNHPLAGKDVKYEITIIKKITDDKEKVKAFFKILNLDADYNEGIVELPINIPEEFLKELEKKLKERVPNVKKITTKQKKVSDKKENSKKSKTNS